jgi:hypothetical protein
LLDPLRDDVERLRDNLRERFRGTLPPFSRASLNPIAIACLRLVTRRPDRPLFSDPRFFRRIADATFFEADFPYFAMHTPPKQMPARCVLATRHRLRKKAGRHEPPGHVEQRMNSIVKTTQQRRR